MTAKNRGSEPVSADEIHLALALGGLRKVKHLGPKKSSAAGEAEGTPDDAFKLVEAAELNTAGKTLAPDAEATFSWAFALDRNCPVTDVSKSLFVVYGVGKDLAKLAHLELQIKPFPVIAEFLNALTTNFRFVIKAVRAAKGPAVEIKFTPPAARAFAALETLSVSFRMDEDRLLVDYAFNMKKVEATAASVETAKRKLQIQQAFDKVQYTLSSGRMHGEAFEAGIQEALSQMENGTL